MKSADLYRNTICLAVISLFIFFSGCSSTPKSTTLPIAQSMMTDVAGDSDVVKYASLELRIAQDKLDQAENAAKGDRNSAAERLAQEALANLKLAEAKTEAKKTRKKVKDMEKNISTLRDEIERAK